MSDSEKPIEFSAFDLMPDWAQEKPKSKDSKKPAGRENREEGRRDSGDRREGRRRGDDRRGGGRGDFRGRGDDRRGPEVGRGRRLRPAPHPRR